MGTDLGRADGAFEDARDLGKREFLETAEQQDFAIIVVQPVECDVEQVVFVAGRRPITCVGSVIGVVVQILRINWSGGRGRFAEVIGGAAAGQMVHPCGETPVIAIGVPVLQHPLENDLGDVLGYGTVPGEF